MPREDGFDLFHRDAGVLDQRQRAAGQALPDVVGQAGGQVGEHRVEGVGGVTDEADVGVSGRASQFHTVASGDTLSAISKTYYGTWRLYPEIFEANKPMLSDPDKIYPGQVLRIPAIATATS